jgi:hypothetical protein
MPRQTSQYNEALFETLAVRYFASYRRQRANGPQLADEELEDARDEAEWERRRADALEREVAKLRLEVC